EYLRFAEKYSRSIFRPDAFLNAGEAYMQAGKAIEALGVFETFLESYPGDKNACRARLHRGRIFKALHRYGEAANELLVIPERHIDCPYVDQAMLDAGECLISAGDSRQAAGVLRRLITQRKRSDLVPRARYGLAIALTNIGRDLEAAKVLGELVSKHRSSPVAALALLKLGDRAIEGGDTDGAEEYFKNVKDRFKEKTLQEKASVGIIGIHSKKGDDKALLEESERFLESFSKSKQRGYVFELSIDAAWRLKDLDRTLSLINSCISEQAVQDSTGELRLLKSRVLNDKGKTKEALRELEDFRHLFTRSPHIREALLLEAELLRRSGSPREAARFYHLTLLE
ncbi:MAG: tetratricopeptide repeat protein, partial [Candidatus Krumholzibacteria bacterium]|nr:tetratricopeptide repeat protein [Candidatus Krumholzibacteria bacterium]